MKTALILCQWVACNLVYELLKSLLPFLYKGIIKYAIISSEGELTKKSFSW